MFNMFVMRRLSIDQYCEWMFSILEEIENRVDISGYDAYEARIYGFSGVKSYWMCGLKPIRLTIKNKMYPLWSHKIGLKRRIFYTA